MALIPVFFFLTGSFLGLGAFLAGCLGALGALGAFAFLAGFSVYDFFKGAFGGADISKSAFSLWYLSLSTLAQSW